MCSSLHSNSARHTHLYRFRFHFPPAQPWSEVSRVTGQSPLSISSHQSEIVIHPICCSASSSWSSSSSAASSSLPPLLEAEEKFTTYNNTNRLYLFDPKKEQGAS